MLAASVEHYIDALRVDGIFCGGVMGEFWALSLGERKRVHEVVVRQAAGRVPVMAQVGHHVFRDTLELCEHAIDRGIHFGIAMNPYYPLSPPPESVRAWYEALADASSLPMFLFNTMYAGYTLSPELIAELADLDTICGSRTRRVCSTCCVCRRWPATGLGDGRLRAALARAAHRARLPGADVDARAGALPAPG
jgi:4-hydroxy-tetrahydrodipicolinate synthase